MFSTLCLVAAQAVTLAPNASPPVENQQYKSIVVAYVAANTLRSQQAPDAPGLASVEPTIEAGSDADAKLLSLEPIPDPDARRSAKSSFECLPAVDDEFSPTSIADGSEVPVPVAPSHVEIRDPAKVSWLDRFSLEEVRIESGHTYFDPSLQDAKTSLPLEGVPGPSTTGNSPVFGPLPTDATTVTRPPQIANPPYRPYRFPQSPQQYREQSMAATTCTGCGGTLYTSSRRPGMRKCGCER